MPKGVAKNWRGREVVIVEAARTAIGRGHPEKGQFRDVHPNELLGATYKAVVERAGIDPEMVEDVAAGAVTQVGEQSNNIARNAWLEAGLPVGTGGATVDRQCGSGATGGLLRRRLDRGRRARRRDRRRGRAHGQGQDVRLQHGPRGRVRHPLPARTDGPLRPRPAGPLGRDGGRPLGDPALRARRAGAALHQLAARAADEGRFDREIVPVQAGDEQVATDQGIRRDTSLEALAGLKPAFKEDGRVTAGNSSQISDGAAAVLLMASGREPRSSACGRGRESSMRSPSASTR